MSEVLALASCVALLGVAVVGGVFFAFSSFVMGALARVPEAEGMRAMQAINVVVINRSFMGSFMGSAVICAVVVVLALRHFEAPGALLCLAGAVVYLIGTFGTTIAGNVPLNERLAAADASDAQSIAIWREYLDRWTRLNTLRTAAAVLAAVLLLAGRLSA